MMLVKQTAAVTGLYLKVQRYENDENDKMDFMDFQKAFNNSLVALSIMFGRYRDAWNTADEANGSMADKLGYAATKMAQFSLRTFSQANFVMDAWRKYDLDRNMK